MQSTWQTCVANARLEFSGEARFQIFTQKPIRHGTFHLQQRSGAVLFQSRNCFESSIPSVNGSPVRYTFCDAPFHYPVQCEHSLKVNRQRPTSVMRRPELKIPTPAKWLISPLVRVIIKICKKHLVLKTNSNINIYNET